MNMPNDWWIEQCVMYVLTLEEVFTKTLKKVYRNSITSALTFCLMKVVTVFLLDKTPQNGFKTNSL